MVKHEDSSFTIEPVPEKVEVAYRFGGRPPLDMEASRAVNLSQYLRARECVDLYVEILDIAAKNIPLKKALHAGGPPVE